MSSDTSPMISSIRHKKRIRIQEVNDIATSFDTTVEYPSDALPDWFKPLQPIVEDWVFTSMQIHLETTHYHITVVETPPNTKEG